MTPVVNFTAILQAPLSPKKHCRKRKAAQSTNEKAARKMLEKLTPEQMNFFGGGVNKFSYLTYCYLRMF